MKRQPLTIFLTVLLVLPCLAAAQAPQFQVSIGEYHGVYQGSYSSVDVTLDHAFGDITSFDFLITYPAGPLSLHDVTPGYFTDSCAWEYFTYRNGMQSVPCAPTVSGGIIRVVGYADVNNGDSHPTCYGASGDSVTLFSLTFRVTDDRTYECADLPIRFYWCDCTDNTLTYDENPYLPIDSVFLSQNVFDSFNGQRISDPTHYPGGIYGAPDSCVQDSGPRRAVDYYDGGIHILCAEVIDDRGDMNLNGISYEPADRELFARYFVYGDSVFTHVMAQAAASDVNWDDIPLTLADLVYMTLVMNGEAPPVLPHEPPSPFTTIFERSNDDLRIIETEPLGAILVVLSGRADPVLDVSAFEFMYAYDSTNDVTRALIYGHRYGSSIGDVVVLSGLHGHDILQIDAVTTLGYPVEVRWAADLPTGVYLSQNYPNPFVAGGGGSTEIYALSPVPALGRLEIFNTLGQRVYSVPVEFLSAGAQTIDWPGTTSSGSRVAPGIYFYRLTVGGTTLTRKMLLLK